MNVFIEENNAESFLFARRIMKIGNSILEVGIYPVMYGWRIRGGIVDPETKHAGYYCFDLCAGADPLHISLIYTTTLNLLVKNVKNIENEIDCLVISRIFPVFEIKPIINDILFPSFLDANIGGREEVSVSSDELEKWRKEFLTNLY